MEPTRRTAEAINPANLPKLGNGSISMRMTPPAPNIAKVAKKAITARVPVTGANGWSSNCVGCSDRCRRQARNAKKVKQTPRPYRSL